MRLRNGTIALSATDVANHLSCTHLTGLNLRLARGEVAAPAWENPHLVVLQQRGMEHERAYLVQVLSETKGNVSRAASLAGRYRAEFYKLLHKYDLDPAEFKGEAAPRGSRKDNGSG